MLEVFVQLCGGIGLFLIGMTMMTDSLKDMAGETLRIWLSKFTGSPIKSVLSGICLTLIVQSSTATTLARPRARYGIRARTTWWWCSTS